MDHLSLLSDILVSEVPETIAQSNPGCRKWWRIRVREELDVLWRDLEVELWPDGAACARRNEGQDPE